MMDENFFFLNLDGLDDYQVKNLKDLLHPLNHNSDVEFPWSGAVEEQKTSSKGSMWNVHAPSFKSNFIQLIETTTSMQQTFEALRIKYESQFQKQNGDLTSNNQCPDKENVLNGELKAPVSGFKLNPAVSSFIPQNTIRSPFSNGSSKSLPIKDAVKQFELSDKSKQYQMTDVQAEYLIKESHNEIVSNNGQNIAHDTSTDAHFPQACDSLAKKQIATKDLSVNNSVCHEDKQEVLAQTVVHSVSPDVHNTPISIAPPVIRSWADVTKSNLNPVHKPQVLKNVENRSKAVKASHKDNDDFLALAEDRMSLQLGKHLHQLELNFNPVFLQPRGLINRRNWCYINATIQALLACPPFYTLLRDLPLGPAVERGKSTTPVIDSMVKVAYEFLKLPSLQEDFQTGQPFQPDFIYDMLKDLKSDCLKGQQEDAEEFLSFILNGMHEEMVKIIKNYEKIHHLSSGEEEMKLNGDVSEGEEEWQVIGSKHRGMVTRKVAEHRTPVSDLLGGQIKSFLTITGSKTSASIQPFFTLQLDIQSENVTSVSEALNQMTLKEPIQGYTCAKTRQEVEAYSHISLQKMPPILILHLKRFVYNKNGGCKKVMKKTDYPIMLELKKDFFAPDVKKSQRYHSYSLFAVMYHDGEEAVKGHYVSDVFNHGIGGWIRCDDRTLSPVTEAQVLSHSPPRVPYLLFYQERDS